MQGHIDGMTHSPRVSVIIPLYNAGLFIERAVRSVLSQTVQDFEAIVVDGNSDDRGPAIVRGMGDPRVRVVQQRGRGVSRARNQGIAMSRADLIAFLDADDEWLPHHLKTLLRLHERYPRAGACATAYHVHTAGGRTLPADIRGLPPPPWEGLIPNYFETAAMGDGPLITSAVAIPKEKLAEFRGFRTDAWWGEDTDLWGRIALQYPIAFTWRAGAVYHAENADSAVHQVRAVEDHPFAAVAEAALAEGAVPPALRDGLQEYVARKRLETAERNTLAGRPDLARQQLRACRTRLFRRRKMKMTLLAWIPAPLYIRCRAARMFMRRWAGERAAESLPAPRWGRFR